MRLGDADWDACVAAGGCRAADVPPGDPPLRVNVYPPGDGQQVPQSGNADDTQPGWGGIAPGGGIDWWLIAFLVAAGLFVWHEI